MSQTPATPQAEPTPTEERRSGLWMVLYAVYGAMQADMGCVIGAVAFVLLVFLSAYFAPQITPCTSAGGIPCAH